MSLIFGFLFCSCYFCLSVIFVSSSFQGLWTHSVNESFECTIKTWHGITLHAETDLLGWSVELVTLQCPELSFWSVELVTLHCPELSFWSVELVTLQCPELSFWSVELVTLQCPELSFSLGFRCSVIFFSFFFFYFHHLWARVVYMVMGTGLSSSSSYFDLNTYLGFKSTRNSSWCWFMHFWLPMQQYNSVTMSWTVEV